MTDLRLSMALSHYDRHIPFFDGSVQVDGVNLEVLEVGQSSPLKHGQDRHERMLQKGEFDICELSLSNYLVAKSRGMPFTAIPVFPRRLFSLSQMWVNVDAGINSPQQLIDRKVGLSTFQTTLSVLARGDLQAEYGVPWRKIDWYISKEEAVPLGPLEGVRMQLLQPGQKMGAMLEKGELDEAIPWFQKAMQAKRYESPAFPHLNLGRVYERKGNWTEAIASYKQALALNPDYVLAKKSLGRLISMLN